MSKLSLLLFSFFSFQLGAVDAGNWTRLTSKAHPNCNHESACRVSETNCSFEVTFVTGDGAKANQLQKLEIRNLKTSKTQSFALDEVNTLDDGEFFELYQVSIKPGLAALALHAYNSAHEGPSYYYFFYDNKSQAYVMDPVTSPKLVFDVKSGLFRTVEKGSKYKLGSDFKFEPID